jgi:exocyst complex protein 7
MFAFPPAALHISLIDSSIILLLFSERVYLAHRGFTVIDPKFREMLQDDIRGVFLKRYKAFFDKYSRIQFSKKNMETYLKYTPQKIDSLVSQLFAQV